MTTPASHAAFRDLARQSLSKRTGIPAKSDWEVFLHGFASTNERSGEVERVIYECLLRTFPTPESVLEQDLRTLGDQPGCQNLLNPGNAAAWMKQNAENWDRIAPLLRCRTRAEQEAIRNFIDDPKNQNKRLKRIAKGMGFKGSDMTLLWGGCEVPVIDKQMMRYLAPHMLGEDWDSHIRARLARRKAEGKQLNLGLRSDAGPIRNIDADEIELNNPTHFTAEEETLSGLIQSTVGRYGAWRDLAYQMADAEGIPANIWHVATWLEYRTVVDGKRGDPDSPRANPKILARAKRFVERTYGPRETPSAEQVNIDPYIFLPLYWGARDRGEESFIYEGQQVAVAYARYMVEYAGWKDVTPEDLETPSAVTDDMLYRLNREVEALTSYGLRDEFVERGRGPAWVMSWSNARATWDVNYRLKAGTTKRLDANQFIGYGKKADLEEASEQLNPLPLYYSGPSHGSYEYKEEQYPGAWADMTPEEQVRWREEAEIRATEARKQIETQLGRELGYIDQDMWDIIIPKQSLMQWALPWPRGDFPHTPLLREKRKSIYYTPGWVKIRAYQVKNPGLTQGQIARDTRFSRAYVRQALRGRGSLGQDWGPRLYPFETERVKRFQKTTQERYGGKRTEWVITPELKAEALEAYEKHSDLSVEDIADMYKISLGALYDWLTEAGIELRGAGPDFQHDHDFIREYKQLNLDLNIQQIADELGIPRHIVSRALRGQTPDAFVGFEGPFGFDDDIKKESKDWIQYKIGDTPVIVRRVGAKPGVKLNPRYKGAGQPQELLIEFRLLASTRRDMERINFLLQRLREDNPTMTVNVNVKTNGKTAHRSLPTWEERPYRMEPAAFMGGMFTPEDYDPHIQDYKWWELDAEAPEDSHYVDAIEHFGTDVTGEGLPTDEEMDLREEMDRSEFASGETSLAHVEWDIADVKVEIDYGPWTSRLGEKIENAAFVSIERYGGKPFDASMFASGGQIAQITDFLKQLQQRNPNIRIVATAAGDEEKGDLRARVYERYGWRRISQTDARGSVNMELLPPDKDIPTAFDGIAAYAHDIMTLV